MSSYFWTEQEIKALTRLYDEGCNPSMIHEKIPHRSIRMIERKVKELEHARARCNVVTRWGQSEIETLLRLVEIERRSWPEIDKIVGRGEGASQRKYDALNCPETQVQIHPEENSAKSRVRALAERDARAGISHTSLTALLFGDPLPGRSALDQRRGAP